MKKKKLAILILTIIVLLFTVACANRDIWDTNRTYDRAIINFGNDNIIEIEIKQWRDYDGEQFQIIDKDGNIYLCSSFNTVMINDADKK